MHLVTCSKYLCADAYAHTYLFHTCQISGDGQIIDYNSKEQAELLSIKRGVRLKVKDSKTSTKTTTITTTTTTTINNINITTNNITTTTTTTTAAATTT